MKIRILVILTALSVFSVSGYTQWVQTNGPYGGNVSAIAISGTTIFAGTGSAQYGGGVFRSTNNGATWSGVNNGLTNLSISCLAAGGSSVFAGTYAGGLFQSTNNGNSWIQSGNGIGFAYITALAANGTNFLAGAYTGGVFISSDNGAIWTPANNGMGSATRTVYTYATIGSNLYAGTDNGIYVSTNGGNTWTGASTGLPSVVLVYAITGKDSNIFAGTYGSGVYSSTNNGKSWTATNLSSAIVLALAEIGSNIVTGESLSANGGVSWISTMLGTQNLPVNALTVSGTNIFAGTNGGGFFISSDSGKSWHQSNNGLTNAEIPCIAVEGSKIFAETFTGGFFSTNEGTSWNAATTGLPSVEINSFAANSSSFFASGWSNGVFRSGDSGATWNQSSNGLPSGSTVYAIAGNDLYLFSTVGDGLFVSNGSGSDWTESDQGLPTYSNFTSLAMMNGNVFVGTDAAGIYVSTDNGVTWAEASTGSFSQNTFNALIAVGTNLFAAADGSGLFLSTDSGASWTAVNTGLADSNILSLAVFDSNLYAGTYSAGVWRRPLSQLLPSPYAIDGKPDSLSFGSVTIGMDSTLYFTLVNTGSAPLTVTSIQGQDSIFSSGKVSLPVTIPPGDSLVIGITFTPSSPGAKVDTVVILSEASEIKIPLSGFGIQSTYILSPSYISLAFGNVIVEKDSTLPFTLKNTGNAALTVTDVNFRPSGAAFTYSNLSLPTTLQPDDSLSFLITFAPTLLGSLMDTLVVISEATELDIPLSGVGISGSGVIDNSAITSSLQSYPNPFSQTATITFSCTESGAGEVTIVNLLGAEVARIFSGELGVGEHSFTWDASCVAPGMYECIVRLNGSAQRINVLCGPK